MRVSPRLLTYSTLFPHAGAPNHGVFVENRLRHLIASGAATSRVVAPVPWFPQAQLGPISLGAWGRFAKAPSFEQRAGLDIHHPRYPVLPKIGMSAAPALLYAATSGLVRRLQREADFDVIDAHYVYPDGVAAVMLGRALNKPVVITARGSDVTQLPDFAIPRRWIVWALRRADALITVSAGLKAAIAGLGTPAGKVTVLRNGVDLLAFTPQDRAASRAALGFTGPTLLSVGLLNDRKGHHRIIQALPELPEWRLQIIGDGPDRAKLEQLAQSLGVADRVTLAGPRPHAELPQYYSAADILVLASSREGWANVLLESMACGTPVVASNIPGNPEVVQEPAAGVIMPENTAAGLVAGIRQLEQLRRLPAETRTYAERFSWDATSQGQADLFNRLLSRTR